MCPTGRDIWCAGVSMDGILDNSQFCICSPTPLPNWGLLVHRVAVTTSNMMQLCSCLIVKYKFSFLFLVQITSPLQYVW